ncbi:hypothetical protein OIU34_10215 [Pararhizobium sp. BT-229]|nr:hypothetical protein [Pararhizobium sp. BT-229]MCV9962272.1 hypothetical protein [Pararhizobium sp. BT-229]
MIVSETQRKSAHREYRQLMFRQFLMWLLGISLPAALLIALFA